MLRAVGKNAYTRKAKHTCESNENLIHCILNLLIVIYDCVIQPIYFATKLKNSHCLLTYFRSMSKEECVNNEFHIMSTKTYVIVF